MLESDWLLTVQPIFIAQFCHRNSKTVQFDLSNYQELVIGQVNLLTIRSKVNSDL